MRVTWFVAAMVSVSSAFAAGDSKEGKTLYERSCKSCHGGTGVANPKIAQMMKVEIKNLSSSEVQQLSDDQLKKIITEGKGKMPAVRSVAGKSIDDVIAYVRTLKK